MLEVTELCVAYGHRRALEDVSLRVAEGEIVTLLGANGSGKSTLLKLLNGIYAPSEGTMRALGRDIKAVAAGMDAFQFHREVGLVFQDPDVQLFSATVFDDVAFGPLQLGLSQDEVKARCDEALQQMEITHLAQRAPFELSGGEKKRAAIASVLSLRPDVILLDEPTASLDPRTKWVLVKLLRQAAHDGGAVLAILHELALAARFADRVLVMDKGRIVADAAPGVALSPRMIAEVFGVEAVALDTGEGIIPVAQHPL